MEDETKEICQPHRKGNVTIQLSVSLIPIDGDQMKSLQQDKRIKSKVNVVCLHASVWIVLVALGVNRIFPFKFKSQPEHLKMPTITAVWRRHLAEEYNN